MNRWRARAIAVAWVVSACSTLQQPAQQPQAAGASTPQPQAAGSPAPPLSTAGTRPLQPPQPQAAAAVPFTPPPLTSTQPDLGASCDPSRTLAPDSRSFIVRDPEVLARFSLERVLRQIIKTADSDLDPNELLQRLFDTSNASTSAAFSNGVHCDVLTEAESITTQEPQCPRAEGKLAFSKGLLRAGDPDFFAPVAIVNRFDLTPTDLSSCGEYRIVFAKQSGLTDPKDRVLLILEAALGTSHPTLANCRQVAELWASLSEPDAGLNAIAERLERFFFEGSDELKPAVSAIHYGLGSGQQCGYSGRCGQLRLGLGMQAPWLFRQYRLQRLGDRAPKSVLQFSPTPDTGTPVAALFDPSNIALTAIEFRTTFTVDHLRTLAGQELPRMRMLTEPRFEAIDSALEGPAHPDYTARVAQSTDAASFESEIARQLGRLPLTGVDASCPAEDGLTPRAMFQRAAATSCAGCHAPERALGADRALGCGQVQPRSLGETHIDEHGQLSEALTSVYLPYRARVLSTYLQACDADAIVKNLQPVLERVIVECFAAGTPITMADGSQRPIEQIAAGDRILAFDESSGALVAAPVEHTAIRPHTDSLIIVNGAVAATPNHPFYTSRGLARAEHLELGDTLLTLEHPDSNALSSFLAASTRIEQLALRAGQGETYNLEVAVHHNYFAGGMLVHDRP